MLHDATSDALKKAVDKFLSDLAGKLIIGALKYSEGWKSISHKVASLNAFSSALSVEEMKKKTEEGSNICDAKGDYLSWKDMQWETYGKERWVSHTLAKPCEVTKDNLHGFRHGMAFAIQQT